MDKNKILDLENIREQSEQLKTEQRAKAEESGSSKAGAGRKETKWITPRAVAGQAYLKVTELPLELLGGVVEQCGAAGALLYLGLCNKAVREGSRKFRVGYKDMKLLILHKTQYRRSLERLKEAGYITLRKEQGKRPLVGIILPDNLEEKARRDAARVRMEGFLGNDRMPALSGVTPLDGDTILASFKLED